MRHPLAWTAFALTLGAITALIAPTTAAAVGAPGTIYSLQIGRTGGPSIQKIAADGSQLGAVPLAPGVLNAPVGITVDAEGYLIVADSDGYDHLPKCTYTDESGLHDPGCGAILRINPDSGAVEVLAQGNKHVNPYGVLLPPDGSVFNGGDDSLIVADSSEGLIKVDLDQPAGSRESYFPGPAQDQTYNRGSWDLARDPVSGDILVTNVGSVPNAPVSGPGCAGPQAAGYVARYTDAGQLIRLYCDPRITAPRGIDIDSTGTAYLADPITRNGDQSYGAVFSIGTSDQIDYKAVGDLFSTPSGLAIDYAGSGLLVADETTQGAGGVIAVDGFGGDQSALAQISGYPIAIAVDRTGAAKSKIDVTVPGKIRIPKHPPTRKGQNPKKTIKLEYSRVNSFDDDAKYSSQYAAGITPTGFKGLGFPGVDPGVKLRFQCLDEDCRRSAGDSVTKKVFIGPSDGILRLDFASPGLVGKFRIFSYRKSSTKGRVIGFVKDFSVVFDSGQIFSKDIGKCLTAPTIKSEGQPEPDLPKRVCGQTPHQVIAKDKSALRKLLTRKVIGGHGGPGSKGGKG